MKFVFSVPLWMYEGHFPFLSTPSQTRIKTWHGIIYPVNERLRELSRTYIHTLMFFSCNVYVIIVRPINKQQELKAKNKNVYLYFRYIPYRCYTNDLRVEIKSNNKKRLKNHTSKFDSKYAASSMKFQSY